MLKAIIIEDHHVQRRALTSLLNEYFHDVISVVGETDSVSSGIKMIQTSEPDVIFLDIELRGESGLSILQAFPVRKFWVVFTTGHAHYAHEVVHALPDGGFSFYTKPMQVSYISAFLKRFHQEMDNFKRIGNQKNQAVARNFLNEYPNSELIARIGSHFLRISFDSIMRVKVVDKIPVLSFFQIGQPEKRLSRNSMTESLREVSVHIKFSSLEQQLLKYGSFFTIKRAFIINTSLVEARNISLDGTGNYVIHLLNGEDVQVAVRRKKAFEVFMNIV